MAGIIVIIARWLTAEFFPGGATVAGPLQARPRHTPQIAPRRDGIGMGDGGCSVLNTIMSIAEATTAQTNALLFPWASSCR